MFGVEVDKWIVLEDEEETDDDGWLLDEVAVVEGAAATPFVSPTGVERFFDPNFWFVWVEAAEEEVDEENELDEDETNDEEATELFGNDCILLPLFVFVLFTFETAGKVVGVGGAKSTSSGGIWATFWMKSFSSVCAMTTTSSPGLL